MTRKGVALGLEVMSRKLMATVRLELVLGEVVVVVEHYFALGFAIGSEFAATRPEKHQLQRSFEARKE